MIRDLSLASEAIVSCDTQVCIIGAGTAGIFLAIQLRKAGLQVVILEAGGALSQSPAAIDNRCEQRGICYRGADLGRSFGLGGTSVLWGGQLLPITRSDVGPRPEAGVKPWPIDYSEIERFLHVVLTTLGVNVDSLPADAITSNHIASKYLVLQSFSTNFDLRLSTWLPFKKRNFSQAFADDLRFDIGLTTWLNSTVLELQRAPRTDRSLISTVTAASPNGRRLHVTAKAVVICAGALESTRLLLALDEQTNGLLTESGAPLGRFFSDHLSVPCARLECKDWRRFNMSVAPIFFEGLMRTPRLELARSAQRDLRSTSAFVHFVFVTRGDTGFDVVRTVLRRRQGEKPSLRLSPKLLWRALTDTTSLAVWRFLYRRLWLPRNADLLLQIDIEQAPNAENRITLSDNRDSLNRKRLSIDWRISPSDIATIRMVGDIFIEAWRTSPLAQLADVQPLPLENGAGFEAPYDVYHPTGTVQMGSSSSSSVVDQNLRLWAIDNCYVSTTAVFPSAGSANPGMTHLALTARLAEHLIGRFRCDDTHLQ